MAIDESGDLTFSKEGMNRVLLELAGMYKNPMQAFKEYVTNAIDAIYDAGIQNRGGKVGIMLSPEQSRIQIADNGIAMSLDKLRRIPVSIGESEKRGKVDMRGDKALGLLSFGTLDSRMLHIVSRQSPNQPYGYLRYEIKKGNNPKITYKLTTLEDITAFGEDFDRGTVIAVDIGNVLFNQKFRKDAVRSGIREFYLPILERGEIDFALKLGSGEEELIKPNNQRGDKIMDRKVPFITTHKGDKIDHSLHIKLYLDPTDDSGKIPVFSKGVKVYQNILEMEEDGLEGCPLWNCRQISGFIDEPNLSLTIGRNSINKQTNAYKGFIETLEGINDKLWPVVRERIKVGRKREESRFLNEVFSDIEEAFQNTKPIFALERREGPRGPVQNPRGPRGPGEPGEPKEPKEKKFPYGRPKLTTFDVNSRDKRNRLETEAGKPISEINEEHPDYMEFVENGTMDQRLEYISRMIAEPMAQWELLEAEKKGKIYDNAERIMEIQKRADDIVYRIVGRKGKGKKRKKRNDNNSKEDN